MHDPRSATFTENEPVRCSECGEPVTLPAGETTATCPALRRPRARIAARRPALDEDERVLPAWLADPAAILGEPGQYLCFEDEDEIVVVPLTREWTRIGRGLAADVRFDDPTVSRRHALIVRNVDGVRVLDDRSLNGVFVNGARVEWSPLSARRRDPRRPPPALLRDARAGRRHAHAGADRRLSAATSASTTRRRARTRPRTPAPSPRHARASAAATASLVPRSHHTSTLGPAPEIVAPSAPSDLAPLDERGRARVEVRAVGLVEAVAQAARHELDVAAREPEHQQRAVRGVEDRVRERHRLPAAPRRASAVATGSAGTTSTASSARRRLDPRDGAVRADDDAAHQRRGDVVGVALDLAAQREHVDARAPVELARRDQPRDGGRGARAEAAAQRDLRAHHEAPARRRARPARTPRPRGSSGRAARRGR